MRDLSRHWAGVARECRCAKRKIHREVNAQDLRVQPLSDFPSLLRMIFMTHRNAVWAREFNAPTTSDDAGIEKSKENSECAYMCVCA